MKSKNVKLSVYIILIWATLSFIVITYSFNETKSFAKGSFNIWAGIYTLYIGIVFVSSYCYPQKTFIFRWIVWFFERPFGKKWALFLGIVAIFFGILSILAGLGLVEI